MPLHHHRKQYELLPEFEKRRIIGMMEVVWSAQRVVRQVSRSDLTVKRCWDQWTEKTSFTGRPCSGHPQQTSHRKDHHIIRNARVQPTASLAAVETQATLSIWAPVSSQTIDCRTSGIVGPITCAANDTHLLTPLFGLVSRMTRSDCNGMKPGRLQLRT
ncbi:transposable element Tcb2 transposase [Trichonephila clavipes]|nr:transposable element Tcb2 transposase [Trichonephila clavipes]